MDKDRSALNILTGKPTEKFYEVSIEIDPKEVSIRGIGLIWLRIGILESPYKCNMNISLVQNCSIIHF